MADYRKNAGKAGKAKDERLEKAAPNDYPLVKRNFVWMGISAGLIVLGFLLMLGGSSTEEFNPDIFSGRCIDFRHSAGIGGISAYQFQWSS